MIAADASILAIDAGNTRIKWGLHDGAGWIGRGALATGDIANLGGALPAAAHAVASNVAGEPVRAALDAWAASRGVALRVIRAAARQLGVANGYNEAIQLGSDRWAALVAAHRLEPGDKLVVNAGTALTVDALAASGDFLGGLIVPGPALMRLALDRGTAALRQAPGAFTEFPRSTPDAIASGAIQACAGAIARMAEAMAHRGAAPGRIILSGGAAAELAAHLPLPHSLHENLVLDGLVLIARAT